MLQSTQSPPPMELCSNCGMVIGRLETPYLWQEHIVCAPCHARLAASTAPLPPPQPVAYYSPQQPQYGLPLSREYKDTLYRTRLTILVLSFPVAMAAPQIGGLIFLIWIVLGVTNIIQKSNWKQKYGNF